MLPVPLQKLNQPAQAAARTRHTKQGQDQTKDWLLTEKDFSPKLVKELLGLMASLGLSTSYQAKVVRSTVIDPVQFENQLEDLKEMAEQAKKELKLYFDLLSDHTKTGRMFFRLS